MAKRSYNRIVTIYKPLSFTIRSFGESRDFDVECKDSIIINRDTFTHFAQDLKFWAMRCNAPIEVTASYAIRFYDIFAPQLSKDEIINPENYVYGYPVVHHIDRNTKFWIVNGKKDIPRIQNNLKKHNLPDKDFLAVDHDLHGVFPKETLTMPLELWNFFNKKHQTK